MKKLVFIVGSISMFGLMAMEEGASCASSNNSTVGSVTPRGFTSSYGDFLNSPEGVQRFLDRTTAVQRELLLSQLNQMQGPRAVELFMDTELVRSMQGAKILLAASRLCEPKDQEHKTKWQLSGTLANFLGTVQSSGGTSLGFTFDTEKTDALLVALQSFRGEKDTQQTQLGNAQRKNAWLMSSNILSFAAGMGILWVGQKYGFNPLELIKH